MKKTGSLEVTPPTLDDLERMARRALRTLPRPFSAHFGALVISVQDFVDEEVEREMGLESPFDLLGLYHGTALPLQSVADTPHDTDKIFLFRRPILDYWCETGEDLQAIVRHVLIHELGHHLGLSDDDMEAIEGSG